MHCFFPYTPVGKPLLFKRVIDVETFSFPEARSPDRKRFIVRADDKRTAFVELASAICAKGF